MTEIRTPLRTGDILLFRGRGLISWAIRSVTLSPYSHVAIAYVDGLVPFCLEMREGRGYRALPIDRAAGKAAIDVYRVLFDEYDPDRAIEEMRIFKYKAENQSKVFSGYSYWMIVKRWLRSVPIIRGLFRQPNGDDDPLGSDFVCSTTVAYAVRQAGVDLVHNLPDALTTPGDIARSAALTNIGRVDLETQPMVAIRSLIE